MNKYARSFGGMDAWREGREKHPSPFAGHLLLTSELTVSLIHPSNNHSAPFSLYCSAITFKMTFTPYF